MQCVEEPTMPEKTCTNCRYYKADTGGILVTRQDHGKCQLTGDKVKWNSGCTKWKEK